MYHTSVKVIILVIFIIFIFNILVGEILHISIAAATCMTTQQVAADSRCLYIWNKQIYNIGSKSNPHHGHPCGTDVTSVMPSSHLGNQAYYLLPNYIANVCTNTPTPTLTPKPTNTPTPTPTHIQPSPTSTITPGQNAVTFVVTVFLHGIFNGGDNANHNGGGNHNPLHQQRMFSLSIKNASNVTIANSTGNLTYNSTAGNFTGTIPIPNLANGAYTISLATASFLGKQVSGFQQISSLRQYTLPSVYLTAGDINNDGQIDISDYNSIFSCFGSKQNSPSCTNAPSADLNDDGLVNGGDYNLFLRELSVQSGQ